MASHYCICAVCKEKFNRDTHQAVKYNSRRYAHYECAPDKELVPMQQKDNDLVALEEYIKKMFGEDYITPRIRKQINQYVNEFNYSYQGILKTLIWWFEIRKNSLEKTCGGIGIVPYIYRDAEKYYYTLFLAEQANKNKTTEIKSEEIVISPPVKQAKKIKLFNLDGE